MIDFSSSENTYLIPPYLIHRKEEFLTVWQELNLDSHIFIMSSGTGSKQNIKTYALAKKSLLVNAGAVNDFLSASEKDRWLCSLPVYHVGGLSILARCHLLGVKASEYNRKWNALEFVKVLMKEKISYCSLVPTQLFDLVQDDISSPANLKGLFIGGDYCSPTLLKRALKLGWKIILTYGMTELSSQIASSYATDDLKGYLKVLPVHKVTQVGTDSYIESQALYTAQINFTPHGHLITEPERKSKFLLPDKLILKIKNNEQFIKPLGRNDDVFKLKGRLYHLNDLKDLIPFHLIEKGKLFLTPDERLGKKVCIEILAGDEKSREEFSLLMLEQVKLSSDSFYFEEVEGFNLTAIGKAKKHEKI